MWKCKSLKLKKSNMMQPSSSAVWYSRIAPTLMCIQPRNISIWNPTINPAQVSNMIQVVWFKNDNQRLSTSDEIYIEDGKEVIGLLHTPPQFQPARQQQISREEKSLWGDHIIFLTLFSSQDGKSSLKIENLSEAHFGMYKCRYAVSTIYYSATTNRKS